MQRDPRAYLWDAHYAAEAILTFTFRKRRRDFEESLLPRSAVERQFVVIGEALNRLAPLDSDLANQIPDLPRIVAFRNILVHGYASVDNDAAWQAVRDYLPPLESRLRQLLDDR